MEEVAHLHVKIDPELDKELSDAIEREERSKKAIVERALRDYIARSKAAAKAAKLAEKAQSLA